MKLLLLFGWVCLSFAQRNGRGGGIMCMFNPKGPGCGGNKAETKQADAATCKPQVNDKEACFMESMMKNKPSDAEKAEMKAAKERVSRNISECFQSRGCRDPVALMKAMGRCMKAAIMEKVMPSWEGCVNKKGYEIPAMIKEKMQSKEGEDEMEMGFKGFGGGGGDETKKFEKMRSKLPIVCDRAKVSEKASNEAFDCAMNAMREGKPRNSGRGGNPGFDPMSMLGALSKCNNKVGGECADFAANRKTAMCDCGREMDFQKIKSDMELAMETCKREQNVNEELFTEEEKKEFERKMGKAKEMIEMICRIPF